MSAAGKPVYARRGDDNEVGRICGILQALRYSICAFPSLGGDLRSLRSGKLCIVFMSAGSLTLVAVGKESDHEAYLKLQLEYLFAQILFSVTEHVQDYFSCDPGFDLRSMLGTFDEQIISRVLDEFSPLGNPGPFLLGSVETLFPISPAIRARASRALQVTGLKTPFTAFALITAGDKLVTMIQPQSPEHQMRVADLQLLLKVVNRQPLRLSSELWIPVCLPLFSTKDFLFCYTQCWDESSKLCLILVSQQGTTHQFRVFQAAASSIRQSLDVPSAESSILEILDSNRNADNHHDENTNQAANESPSGDVKWRRSALDEDQDTVPFGDFDSVMPYLPCPAITNGVFLREVKAACCPDRLHSHIKHYLDIGSAMHFLFRIEVPLMASTVRGDNCKFKQCVVSPLGFPFLDEASRRRVWTTYQKLRLRLCLGSATVESTMQAWDEMPIGQVDEHGRTGSMSQHFVFVSLANASPEVEEGLAFVVDESELFMAIIGNGYEFYTVLPRSMSLREATASGTKLVRRLFADQRSLFLYHPMTWSV